MRHIPMTCVVIVISIVLTSLGHTQSAFPTLTGRMHATAGDQRRHGRWQIVPETSQAAFTLEL